MTQEQFLEALRRIAKDPKIVLKWFLTKPSGRIRAIDNGRVDDKLLYTPITLVCAIEVDIYVLPESEEYAATKLKLTPTAHKAIHAASENETGCDQALRAELLAIGKLRENLGVQSA